MKKLFYLLLFLTSYTQVFAQTDSNIPVAQNLFVLGNLEEVGPSHPLLDELDALVKNQKEPVTILFAGDFVDKDGLETKPTEQEITKLKRLMSLGDENTQIVFIPGDREWDEGRKKGLKKVKELEDFISDNGSSRHHFLAEDGCPGPMILDIGKTLRIVGLNTHWFVHEHKRPEEQDADCDLLNEGALWGEIEDIVSEDENRNIVIAGHHPVISYGRYAGYRLTKEHFSPPIVGTFIAGYRQNIGRLKDLSRAGMAQYAGHFEALQERFQGLIFASGHEYDVQLNEYEQNYHINSGAFLKKTPVERGEFNKYKHKKRGLAQLRFYEDGSVDILTHQIKDNKSIEPSKVLPLFSSACNSTNSKLPQNDRYVPCRENLFSGIGNKTQEKLATVIAGPEYKKGFFHKIFIGEHFRKAWSTPVNNIPYLDLDTTYGGLTAYAKGGAAQTRSVRFRSADGQVLAFRSVNKDPTQKKGKELSTGVAADVFKDITSSQHPYAGNILDVLMTEADIANPEAKLFILPDHPNLGPYREEFKGMLGWLEKRPKSKKPGRKPYRDADKVMSTMEMNKMLFKDHDHQMDTDSYLWARLFDMWVADWDRHHKNWSWLGYGDKKKSMIFKPFAKDRDKALTRMDGLFRALDWPMVARDMYRLRKSVRANKVLGFKSKNADRQHLMTYHEEDLLKEVTRFQQVMTDEVIESAVKALPPEVYDFDAEWLIETLKVRRESMPKQIKNYYKKLAKYIHFIGSNKMEIFDVTRMKNGDVKVSMFKKKKSGEKGKLLKERICKRSETKEIRLFGLGGKDEFNIDGDVKKSIPVRIIGGKSADQIKDESKVSGTRKHTLVYDFKGKDKISIGPETKKKNIPEEISFEMNNFFQYDYPIAMPSLAYNIDDGFVFAVSGNTTVQKFNKPGFGSRYNITLLGSTLGRININAGAGFRHVIHKWDLNLGVNYGTPDYTFPRFFGLGNNLNIDEQLLNQDYYDNRMETFRSVIGLSRQFAQKSTIAFDLITEYHDVRPDTETGDGSSIYDFFPQDITTTLVGPRMNLNLDFRDDGNFPTKGIQMQLMNYSFLNEAVDWKLGGRTDLDVSTFWSLGAKMPVTLGVNIGASQTYGETPFYTKSFLGQTNHLRGYRRNRFGGDGYAYLNTELRWHIGRVQTRLAPFYWGILGFYDAGRVWLEGESSDNYHNAVGGGFYLIPYDMKSFNIVITVAHSEEEQALINFGVGFFVR